VLSSFVAGVGAGLGVAIPVGAIAVLIIETGLRRGFTAAAAAGAGAATVDGAYATVAALFGGAVASLVAPVERPIRIVSTVILVVIAIRLLLSARASGGPAAARIDLGSRWRTYLTFVGLTAVNPMTLVYFAALIVGLPERPSGAGEQLAFAGGAFGASFAWQMLIAGVAAIGHRRLPPSFRAWTTVAGAVIVLALAALVGLEAIRA
jgi:threonine/homoserine/homoserine lactone efflux protein